MMFRLWLIILPIMLSLSFVSSTSNWELAVGVTKEIHLISNKGEVVKKFKFENASIEALALQSNSVPFLFFTNSKHENSSIFLLDTSSDEKDFKYKPLVTKQTEGTVRDMAYDALKRTLFWSVGSYIKYLNLNTTQGVESGMVLHDFGSSEPFGISIDVCRRTMYWILRTQTESIVMRSDLDGNNMVKLRTTRDKCSGIVVDQGTQRVYWTEKKMNFSTLMHIYGKILSTNDTEELQLQVSAPFNPVDLCVLNSRFFWTDSSYDSIYSIMLNDPDYYRNVLPSEFTLYQKSSNYVVHGIVSITQDTQLDPEICKSYIQYRVKEEDKAYKKIDEKLRAETLNKSSGGNVLLCLNGGIAKPDKGGCLCKPGYSGDHCDLPACYNYCLHDGECSLVNNEPVCRCADSWEGSRCDRDKCQGLCYNGGTCVFVNGLQKCECTPDYGGDRCEKHVYAERHLCYAHCSLVKAGFKKEQTISVSSSQDENPQQNESASSCRCQDFKSSTSDSEGSVLSSNHSEDNKLYIYLLSIVCSILVATVCVLIYKNCSLKNKRPRLKKRIIVNKNVTPSGRQPHATEHCEITIENCCNMNICETPCFEPTLREPNEAEEKNKKEEKRNLLMGIDLPPDDLY